MAPPPRQPRAADGAAAFATTQWNLIVVSRLETPAGREALDQLCRIYWPALFAYARRDGLPLHDAQDAVQGFLERLLHREDLHDVAPEHGRFRSFLFKAFKNYLVSRARGTLASKRGGGSPVLPWDTTAEAELGAAEFIDAATPDRAFDRAWAQRILERALERLAGEHRSPSQERVFLALRPTLMDGDRIQGATALAEQLGLSPGALATAATRLRQRYRELIRDEVGQTLQDPADLQAELEALWLAWS